jgi:predicted N-acyltransferase
MPHSAYGLVGSLSFRERKISAKLEPTCLNSIKHRHWSHFWINKNWRNWDMCCSLTFLSKRKRKKLLRQAEHYKVGLLDKT